MNKQKNKKAVQLKKKKGVLPVSADKHFLSGGKAIGILAAFTFVLFANTFWNKYALDDIPIIESSYVQQGIKGIVNILTHPYLEVRGGESLDYRPISPITFAVEKSLFGNNPHIGHIVNVLLFIAIVLLLFYFFEKVWFGDFAKAREWAFISCLLYVAHPIHTEVVASLKNREELLSFLFVLLWFGCYRLYLQRGNILIFIVSFILLLLSLMSKVVSIPFFALALFWCWYFESKKSVRFYVSALLNLGFVLSYIRGVRNQYASRTMFDIEFPLLVNETLWNRWGMAFDSVAFYIKMFFIPYPLRFYYGYNMIPVESFFSFKPFLVFLFIAAATVYAVYKVREKKVEGYFLISTLVIILFFSNLLADYAGIVGERALFQASAFAIAFLVLKAESVSPRYRYPIFAVIIIVFSVMTVKRNFEWKDMLTLVKSDIKHLHNSVYANHLYVETLLRAAENTNDNSERISYVKEAEQGLDRIFGLVPRYADAYYFEGFIAQYYYNDLDRAIYCYHLADSFNTNPVYNALFYQLGRAYCMIGDFDRARPVIEKLYKNEPENSEAMYFYARCLFSAGEKERSFEINTKLIETYPEYSYAYLNHGWLYEHSGNVDSTVAYYQKAVDLNNSDPYVLSYLEKYYNSLGSVSSP